MKVMTLSHNTKPHKFPRHTHPFLELLGGYALQKERREPRGWEGRGGEQERKKGIKNRKEHREEKFKLVPERKSNTVY